MQKDLFQIEEQNLVKKSLLVKRVCTARCQVSYSNSSKITVTFVFSIL